MNFTEASEQYLRDLENRQVRRSSLKCYESILRVHLRPRWGHVTLEDIASQNNRALKELVHDLRDKYKPASIQAICLVFKQVLDFPCDANGVRLYRCEWNRTFACIPTINPLEQRAPMISTEELQRVVADHRDRLLFATLAGTGMRISECLALRSSDWDQEAGILFIRSGKTASAVREIDIAHALNDWLKSAIEPDQEKLFPASLSTYRERSRGVTGAFHSMRRFRLTHLRRCGMPEDLLRYALGHADRSISDRYSRLRLDRAFRREQVEKCGLGFVLSEHLSYEPKPEIVVSGNLEQGAGA
ncbi:MAG: tyrosine-type recombinase/integrase [Candidatus Micrarchaeaceae archaeon]